MIPKEKPDYPSLAKHIANWEVDSLFFVSLDAQKVAELSSYLANVDIWSEKAKGAKGKKLKYFLWPTAYHPKLLIQGSRYLEGALLVNPVQTQMPNLVFFEKNASQALNRNLNLYDHFFVELVDQIDHHIRMSQIQGIPLKESLKKNRIEARFLKSVSYDTPDILKELQEITIDQGEFKGYPIEETTQPPTPSEPPPEN
jgi:hypothetical protein